MELVRSGWTRLAVMELRPDSLTVLLIHLEHMTVVILKMLESLVNKVSVHRCSYKGKIMILKLNSCYGLLSRINKTARRHCHQWACGDLQR